MSRIVIDSEKCKHDQICVEVCPRRLFVFDQASKTPELAAGAEEDCIDCGHCAAVCPGGAITLNDLAPEQWDPLKLELIPSPEGMDLLLRGRRSIRAYKDKPVEPEVLDRLLETCRFSPTGSNSQSVGWIVVETAQARNRLAGLVVDWMRDGLAKGTDLAKRMNLGVVVEGWDRGEDRIFRGAPQVVLTHSRPDASMARENCVIALTCLDLAAFSLGLGSCWVGYLMMAADQYGPLQEALALPEGEKVYGAMMIGYPKYGYRLIPPRNQLRITRF